MWRFEELVEASRTTETVADLAHLYKTAVHTDGFENCVLTSLRGDSLGQIGWFEFPRGYPDAYIEGRWDTIDPVLKHCSRAARLFFWSGVIDAAPLSRLQQAFMRECENLQVCSEMVFPFHGPGARLDVMSISRRSAAKPDLSRTAALLAMSTQAWLRYLELTGAPVFASLNRPALTPRETEVLRWCKDGKTRAEIGDILSISEKNVEFHLSNIMVKLGVRNQTASVVTDLKQSIIDP